MATLLPLPAFSSVQSLGVCIGAGVAGVGLAWAGWSGAGLGLAVVTLLAALAAVGGALSLRPRGAGRRPGEKGGR